ncbi:MAG: copper resistance CopC/CopD family protein [Acidimicrobiales bacterium]
MTNRGHRLRAIAAALLLGVAILLAGAEPAAAHASLISVDPPDGARLDEAPETVTLTFSERVSADLGGVRVLDAAGERVDEGAVQVDGAVVTVGLGGDLPEGTYVVSYRVISADGHPVRGGSLFGVGDASVDTGALGRVAGTGDDRVWEIIGGIGRGFAYAGVLLAAGGGLFLALVHRDGPERLVLVRLVRAAAGVGAVASLVALPVQAALGTGQGPGSLFDDGVLADVAADGVGHGLLLCLVGLVLLSVGVRRSRPAVVVGAVVSAGSFAATGHTRVGDTALLATLADVAHLVAAAVWGGGLVLLWWTLHTRQRGESADPTDTAGIVTRFSDLATISILVVGGAGLALGWSEVRALSALTGTSYGWFLVAKVAMVAAIAAVGAYNHFRLVPALRQGKAKAALARLRRTLQVEAVGLVAVLALTSVLVVLTPARASTEGGVVEEIVQLGDIGSVQVVVSPAKAGPNQIHLYTYDPSGRPTEIAESITLELTLRAAQIGPLERVADRAGPAHFQLNGDDLAVGGRWQLTIRARVDRFTEATTTVEVQVAT